MSDTDSFIEEVTEEVQRDKLFQLLKRWGWVAGLAVLLLVGGAAYNEWRKASERQIAQDFGDRLLANLDADDGGAGLADVELGDPAQAGIAGHLAAAVALGSGDTDAGLAQLEAVKNNSEVGQVYRDLAAFKAALALPADTPAAERIAAFESVGGTFRILAQEQMAQVMITSGDTDGAAALLRTLIQAADAPPGLQRRASEMIVALGRNVTEDS